MMKNIFSLVAIAVIGTSTCMAKSFTKPANNPKPRMEHKAVMPPTTTTVTTTKETVRPNGTRVITTTTTKTIAPAPAKPNAVKPHHPTCHKHHKHHRGTCKDCKKLAKPHLKK